MASPNSMKSSMNEVNVRGSIPIVERKLSIVLPQGAPYWRSQLLSLQPGESVLVRLCRGQVWLTSLDDDRLLTTGDEFRWHGRTDELVESLNGQAVFEVSL